MKTYYKTETLEDFLGLIDELREDENFVGAYLNDVFYKGIWNWHKNNTCLVKKTDDFGSVSVNAIHVDEAHEKGMRVIKYKVDETDKAKELQKYSEQIAKKKEDLVNHPAHYNQYSQEVIDTIEEVTVNMPVTVAYHVGNAVKYLFRAPFKGKLKQDLEKAVWYLERAVSKL